MNKTETICDCGRPLHYTDPLTGEAMKRFVRELGPNIRIWTRSGSWWVPRHYIALHGLKSEELPALAARYGWSPAADP